MIKTCNTREETITLFKEAIPYFGVLADEIRQQILMVLSETDSMQVSQLAEKIPLSRPAISHHLKLLKQVGLVGMEREGTRNYYYLTLKDVVDMLKSLAFSIEKNCTLK